MSGFADGSCGSRAVLRQPASSISNPGPVVPRIPIVAQTEPTMGI
jgi:hypothetical protein